MSYEDDIKWIVEQANARYNAGRRLGWSLVPMTTFPDPVKNAGSIIFEQGQAWHCDGTIWIPGLPPGSNVTATGPGTFNVNGGTATNNTIHTFVLNSGAVSPAILRKLSGEADEAESKVEESVCECGSEKVGSPSHSSWCPKAS